MRSLLALTVIVVLCLIGLHEVIPHSHAEEIFGFGLQAALHAGDREWLMMLLLLSFVFLQNDLIKIERTDTAFFRPFFRLAFDLLKLFDPLRAALRRGILQPKGW